MSEDKELKQWKEKLFYQPKNGYDRIDAEQAGEIFAYAEGYKQFLNAARTEREAVKEAIRMAEAEGIVPYTVGMELQPGSKVYVNNRGKALMLAVLGQQPLDHGCVIAGAHIDSPRLDLKQTPMYEDSELAYFKTHYYGGIKKYQWVTIPLELHGTVALKDGSTVDIAIGREPDEPQFVITDLLPHLGKEQMRKTMEEGITGEALNIVIGSMPYAGEGGDRVKLAVLSLLHDEYGITEEDFLSAELAAVPAFPARDIGFDRSMIGAYGQDDRVCAYAELRAILDLDGAPERTAVCILADKEEIGSDGVSGMQSQAFEAFMADLCEQQDVALRHCFAKNGGNLGTTGSVSFMFDEKGVLVVERTPGSDEEEMMMMALDAGAEDMKVDDDAYEIYTAPNDFSTVREALEKQGVTFLPAEVDKIPQNTVALPDEETIQKIQKLLEMLEDNDDVQNVYHNAELPEEEDDED